MSSRPTAQHRKFFRKHSGTIEEDSREFFRKYENDPALFASEVLGLYRWNRGDEMLYAIRDYRKVSVKAGHKVSKSCSSVAAALWFCLCRFPGTGTRVGVTAPSLDQVKNIFWEELTNMLIRVNQASPKLRRMIGGDLPLDPKTGFRLSTGGQILAVVSNTPERMAGISGRRVLVIFDEATGYPDPLYHAMVGNTAGMSWTMALSNATTPLGWFMETFEDPTWHSMTIDSRESPNVVEDREVVPGMATKYFVDDLLAKHGFDGTEFRVRVRGLPPDQVETQIAPKSVVEASQANWRADGAPNSGRLVVGVDPARFGDDECVIKPVRELYGYHPRILAGRTDGDMIANAIVEAISPIRETWDHRVTVVIDGAASGATAVDATQRLAEREGLIVVVHEGYLKALDEAKYGNRRTEAWFKTVDWMRAGGVTPPDPMFQKEILAGKYFYDRERRFMMPKKERMKKDLGGKSPNRADGLTMAAIGFDYLPPDPDYQPLPSYRRGEGGSEGFDDDSEMFL